MRGMIILNMKDKNGKELHIGDKVESILTGSVEEIAISKRLVEDLESDKIGVMYGIFLEDDLRVYKLAEKEDE